MEEKKEIIDVENTSIQETPTEEKKIEKERNEPLDNKPQKPAVETYSYSHPALQNIEDSRKDFLRFYKKQNILKWVIGLLCLAIVIFAWIGIPNIVPVDSETGKQPAFVIPLIIVVAVVVLVAVFVYTFLTKRYVKKRMRDYFSEYYSYCKDFVFDQEGFEEAELQFPDKIERVQFDENLIYCNVAEIGSRGLTEFKFNGDLMMVCDCAAQVKNDKSIMPVFVGKYLVAPAAYAEENQIIIYLKGDHRALPPTNLEGIKAVFDDKVMSIYSNNKDWSKVVNAKVLKSLKAIKIGKELIDVAISVNNGKVYFCLGYDDPLMVLPLEQPFNPKPITEYKKDMAVIAKLAEEFSK